jgi:hypothetical protein
MTAFDPMFMEREREKALRKKHKNSRCAYYAQRFGLSELQQHNLLRTAIQVDQLDRCKDDAARRLILGISK